MWFILKNKTKEQSIEWIQKLRSDQVLCLRNIFIDHQKLPAFQAESIYRLIGYARKMGWWLTCDCNPKNTQPPLMTFRKNSNGTISLVHLNNRELHAKNCPFKEKTYFSAAEPFTTIKNNHNLFLHLAPLPSFSKNIKETNYLRHKTTHRCSKLMRLLYTLSELSLWNVIELPIPTIREQYQSLYRQAKEFHLADDILLSDYLWTFPNNIGKAVLKIKKSKSLWGNDLRPCGVFMVIANAVESKSIICAQEKRKIILNGSLEKSPSQIGTNEGPYLAIFSLAENLLKNNWIEPTNGFVVPVFSGRLLTIVENDNERGVLKKLIDLLPWWEKRGVHVKIKKPHFAFPINVADGVGTEITELHVFYGKNGMVQLLYKPSFIIETKVAKIYVNVICCAEDRNLHIKQRNIISPDNHIIEFDALAANLNDEWAERLSALIKQISHIIFE